MNDAGSVNTNSPEYKNGFIVGVIATVGLGKIFAAEGAAETAPTEPYSRASYSVNSRSTAAQEARAAGEGQPCPACGKMQSSGTDTAPWAQHEPPLSEFHYEFGGAEMTSAQKKAYSNSSKAYNKSKCARCQRVEGAKQRQYTKKKNDDNKPDSIFPWF